MNWKNKDFNTVHYYTIYEFGFLKLFNVNF